MRHEVTEADTAITMGSGDVPVLATPRLVAWMEAATLRAAQDLAGPGQTTVGTGIRIDHQRASAVGDTVEVVAEPSGAPDGARVTFSVRATDSVGRVVGIGEIDRVIVDRERFLDGARRASGDT